MNCFSSSTGYTSAGLSAVYLLKFNAVDKALISAYRFDQNRNEYTYGIARDAYGFIAMTFSTDSTSNDWCQYVTASSTYYRTAGIFKFSSELSDFSAVTSVSGLSLSLVSNSFKQRSMTGNIDLYDITIPGFCS